MVKLWLLLCRRSSPPRPLGISSLFRLSAFNIPPSPTSKLAWTRPSPDISGLPSSFNSLPPPYSLCLSIYLSIHQPAHLYCSSRQGTVPAPAPAPTLHHVCSPRFYFSFLTYILRARIYAACVPRLLSLLLLLPHPPLKAIASKSRSCTSATDQHQAAYFILNYTRTDIPPYRRPPPDTTRPSKQQPSACLLVCLLAHPDIACTVLCPACYATRLSK